MVFRLSPEYQLVSASELAHKFNLEVEYYLFHEIYYPKLQLAAENLQAVKNHVFEIRLKYNWPFEMVPTIYDGAFTDKEKALIPNRPRFGLIDDLLSQ